MGVICMENGTYSLRDHCNNHTDHWTIAQEWHQWEESGVSHTSGDCLDTLLQEKHKGWIALWR